MSNEISVQMKIGQNPPFLTRNNTKVTPEYPSTIRRMCRRPKETECASFTILESKNMEIGGFINNRSTIIPITVRIAEPAITFSCFDEIHLFFYNDEDVYYTKFYCCRNWEINTLRAVKIDFNVASPEEIFIPIEIKNLRDDSYHYNINQSIAPDKYSIRIETRSMTLPRYQCPICFRVNTEIGQLKRHMAIHMRYRLESKEGQLHIVRRMEDPLSSIEYENRSTKEVPIGIDFYDERIYDEEDEMEYIDFCAGIAEDTESSDSLQNKDISMKSTADTSKPTKLCIRVNNPIELAEWKIKAKEKNVSRIEMTPRALIKRTVKRDGKIGFKKMEIGSQGRPYNTGTYFLMEQVNKVSYIRNKAVTSIVDYRLKKYGLLMEREFDSFDYTGMLAKYINKELEEKLELDAIEEKEFEVMEKWNESILKEGSVEKALASLLKRVGLNRKTIELMELLYTRGILNSEELVKILETE